MGSGPESPLKEDSVNVRILDQLTNMPVSRLPIIGHTGVPTFFSILVSRTYPEKRSHIFMQIRCGPWLIQEELER